MRTPSKKHLECLENRSAYQYILHTKKTDFTELDRICKEFEEAMVKAQDEDRKKSRF